MPTIASNVVTVTWTATNSGGSGGGGTPSGSSNPWGIGITAPLNVEQSWHDSLAYALGQVATALRAATPTTSQIIAEREIVAQQAWGTSWENLPPLLQEQTQQAANIGLMTRLNGWRTPTVQQEQAYMNLMPPYYASWPSLDNYARPHLEQIANLVLLGYLNGWFNDLPPIAPVTAYPSPSLVLG